MSKKSKISETPLMKQYNSIKARYPDAILLFRVGDFYETFGADAIKAAEILGIVLTKRANGAASSVELAGFPHHSLDTYLPKLVKAGHRVAICEQLEDPKTTKKIVKRGVTELITPGVSYNDNVLSQKENNFLAALHLDQDHSGISFLDISTGEFFITEGKLEYIDKLMQSFNPREVVIQRNKRRFFIEYFGERYYINVFDDWVFSHDFGYEKLCNHFETLSLKGFGIEDHRAGTIAAGAVLHYLMETHNDKISHISGISRIDEGQYVWLDKFTIRNLELLCSPYAEAKTLLQTLDQTVSPMGSRLLKRWIALPLKDRKRIEERHQIVEILVNEPELLVKLQHHIKQTGDLERLISKVALGRVNPREMLQIAHSIEQVRQIKQLGTESDQVSLAETVKHIDSGEKIQERIQKTLHSDPPALIQKGGVIGEGISEELDELRSLARSGKEFLSQLQKREMLRTGISSLKVGFNNVFGYYLEVTNAHKNKVPPEWNRKQTLTGSERYITEELKAYEEKILGAEERMAVLELQLFTELIEEVREYVTPIQRSAAVVARLDCLCSFAFSAVRNHYAKPEMNDSFVIHIREGRHPVIEQQLATGEIYVANDVFLDTEKQQILMITGPNMSGKSALLRQTALIVLMAQMGSFVPARSAELGIVDKVFTRVGASDNISLGESTFMVEMNETASILNNISSRSLILLDEIGRGTSTYDGISIAWAITEYLHEHPVYRPKVMFATHYHELNEMAASFQRIHNWHVSVKETANKIVFLRKLKKGGSAHSFGIHVATLAGMPRKVIDRANKLLTMLEKTHSDEAFKQAGSNKTDSYQLSFIQLDDPLLLQIKDDILNTNIDTLTPVEALLKLHEIRKLLGK
ncbi:MAG: DNA mismatch repair protein MutS [Bacteroidales bacterium]|jgi:DNA mismatch repair protein MutS|nr:DNA mismatch repair protein MutS [Bacteroidales bacterium]MDD3700146.1 DNA mismatch repair protein MutS [Bacteroidales bacterium]MDY0369030.1 DNA mismatch repair protein MutS [Bacteroidales bacterium]